MFFLFLLFFPILQRPRLFVKDPAEAPPAAAGAAEAAGARAAKPVAARAELAGEKRLAKGAAWRWGEPPDEACRMGGTGWYPKVAITEKEGGLGRKTNLTLPSYVWVGGETAKWPNAAEGETVAAFLCLFGMSDSPPRKKFLCGGCTSLMKHRGSTMGGKCGRSCTGGGGASTTLGGMRPPNLCVMQPPHGSNRMRPRGGGPPSI